MIIAETKAEVVAWVNEWKKKGLAVGFVPTMGALHEGHASLVAKAKEECDKVVCSIFVNPTQFAEGEDFDRYPKTFEADCKILKNYECDMVFHPSVSEIYSEGAATYVDILSPMTEKLCGRKRPGHFRGVCTVVSKLFNIVSPHRAYFGEKDAQQLAVIRRMTKDMAYNIEIVGCPTIREADGLAGSSRNRYLTEDERKTATVIYRGLKEARKLLDQGCFNSECITEAIRETIESEPMVEIEYIEACDGITLESKSHLNKEDLIAVACMVGNTRLIDNIFV